MTRAAICCLLTLVLARTAHADEIPMNAGTLAHSLDRLSSTGRVLYIAAHPDDENTRLLAYLANARHVGAAYLSMTRGGGGQNLIGREQDDLLDSLRTHELLAARALDAAQQRFTRMRDFGYSKSAEETLVIWGKEAALEDVVLVIRTFQPDVIVTRFDEKPPNHGHHTASAILAREAFAAAADPARFPEQVKAGIAPWQAQRLVHNVPHWRKKTEPLPAGALTLDVGGYDTRLGLGYGELAARSRSQHKSQGFGIAGERGELLEHFIVLTGQPAKADLLEGIALSWARFGAKGEAVDRALAEARRLLHRDHPERALSALLEAGVALEALPSTPRVREATAALSEAIATCAGIFVRATAPVASGVPGAEIELRLEALARRSPAVLRSAAFAGGATRKLDAPLDALHAPAISERVRIAPSAPISMPHWLADRVAKGKPFVATEALSVRPEPLGPAPLSVENELELPHGSRTRRVRLTRPVLYTWTDRVHGERMRPFLVMPPATVTPARHAVMLANGGAAQVALRIRASTDNVEGQLDLGLPQGWSAQPATAAIKLARAGDESIVSFAVKAPRAAAAISIEPGLTVAGTRWAFREDVIDHAHVPLQVILQPSRVALVPMRIATPDGLIGYIEGSGDTIAEDLVHIGLRVEALDDAALQGGDLKRYAAIVLGVRAYNTRVALRSAQARLMRYVEGGGALVVQYNTSSENAPLTQAIGPYPLKIGRGRVTDENAAVTIPPKSPTGPKSKTHPLLTTPNRIAQSDFAGWVQERGLYFAETWDERYEPLLELADPNEPAQLGSTLVARHGRGRFVYTGLSFFRQLPAGVPGAYRLFVNLLSK